ncbi:MAG: hypothetical protein GW827_06520 [Flavobacteriales bacterium]|nr:hypothetical protein [Flavobacteriales bacterium]NCT16300.1 hypothetical protein [Flavobacteriales bacterium]
MISPAEIKVKAERKYNSVLQNLLDNIPFTKLIIRGDKTYSKSSLSEFEKELELILSHSKEKRAYGYTLDFQKVKTNYLGIQDLPISIYFESEKDYLKYLGKEKEVEQLKINAENICSELPELKEWVLKNPSKIIIYSKEWDNLILVCQYFKDNPNPNLFVRELPIAVHTKFIELYQSILKDLLNVLLSDYLNEKETKFEKRFNLKFAEPQVRFKILDKAISATYFSGLDDLAILISQFEQLNLPIQQVIIVENKTSLYTTLTLPELKKTIAVFGGGYGVINLKNVAWFKNVNLFYWGDIDVQGFEILSQFRGYFSHVKSMLMDQKTFDLFFENDAGTPSSISIGLNLLSDELAVYKLLKTNNWRLEQEKIPLSYVNEALSMDVYKS